MSGRVVGTGGVGGPPPTQNAQEGEIHMGKVRGRLARDMVRYELRRVAWSKQISGLGLHSEAQPGDRVMPSSSASPLYTFQ